MSILKNCENCVLSDLDDYYANDEICVHCYNDFLYNITKELEYFFPREELVRQDEKNKFITLLKSDLETLDKESKHYNNLKEYIESTIELLDKEK